MDSGPEMQQPAQAALDWSTEGADWPQAEYSRFVSAAGFRWHIQTMGQGPPLLLVHGTGASTHSWRSLMPLLAKHYTVLAPDLPGHAFSERIPGKTLSLPNMASALAALLEQLEFKPRLTIGHSAGVAILIRCCLDQRINPESMISLNGALMPFRGAAGVLFPPLAKLLFVNPLAPRLLARSAANRDRVIRLIRGTGSELDSQGIDLYARLFSNSAHVAATLGMMANWDLHRFRRELPRFEQPLELISAARDLAVPPGDAQRIQRLLPQAQLHALPGLGHLAHEEDAQAVLAAILSCSSVLAVADEPHAGSQQDNAR